MAFFSYRWQIFLHSPLSTPPVPTSKNLIKLAKREQFFCCFEVFAFRLLIVLSRKNVSNIWQLGRHTCRSIAAAVILVHEFMHWRDSRQQFISYPLAQGRTSLGGRLASIVLTIVCRKLSTHFCYCYLPCRVFGASVTPFPLQSSGGQMRIHLTPAPTGRILRIFQVRSNIIALQEPP